MGALALSLAPSVLRAQTRAPGMFFGTTVGGGVAWIAHPEITPNARPGVVWDVVFGIHLTRRWSVGAALTSWQDSAIGTPAHLHTFAPRVELTLGPNDGLYLAALAGLGMTDGDVHKRAGFGAGASVGYRIALNDWVSLSAEGGVLAHAYGDGWAAQPVLALHLRFHGFFGDD